jgi:KDO2-lipid IV(A) lauroyltransferase
VRLRLVFHWLAYVAIRLAICAIQALPVETCVFLARRMARIACDVIGIRRRVVDDNLRRAFPELAAAERRRMARATWEHLLLMVVELAFAQRKIHETNWRRYIRLRRGRELVGFMLDPRPKVAVSGHFGNFEIAGYAAGLLGFPTFTVFRTLDNPFLDAYVTRFRAATGQYILPKRGSAPLASAVLESGGILALLGDQHAGPKGLWIGFLGRPASHHKAVALFALTHKAPLGVVYARRLDAPLQFELGCSGVVDPADDGPDTQDATRLTTWYARRLEELVKADIAQYWWVHNRWKDDRAARRRGALHRADGPAEQIPAAHAAPAQAPSRPDS